MLQSAQRAPCLLNALAALSGAPANQVHYQLLRTSVTQAASAAPAQANTPLPSAAFSDHEAIFQDQPTPALLRALLVFRFCAIPAFVRNAESLLNLSKTVLGNRITTLLVRETFFKHFCAGENDAEVQAKTRQLQARGIGSILDYAAEDDVKPEAKKSKSEAQQRKAHKEEQDQLLKAQGAKAGSGSSVAAGIGTSTATPPPTDEAHLSPSTGQPVLLASPAVARQFKYENEEQCDAHVDTFLSCIESASKMPGQGFAAVKLTALGNPRLLERVSSAIQEVRALFAKIDTDGSGFLDKDEFKYAYSALLEGASDEEQKRVFKWMDTQKQGKIDYVAWCQRLSLTRMPEYALRIKDDARAGDSAGPASAAWRHSLQEVALTDQEVKLVHACRTRLMRLAEAAAKQNVKLMIDAEHTYMQPAIDHLTLELMRKYNTHGNVIIYNTYQAYLKDSHTRLVLDLERARREGYVLGAKLVRGAYLGLERARAMSLGYPSPVWDTLEDTHSNYARCMEELLVKVQQRRAELMLGTHNQISVEQAVARMAELGLDPSRSPVYFGQLLGMSDHLTRVLGGAGYHAYKYVPYGKVEQVIPYLLRRAAENAAIMQGTKKDVQLLQAELTRRLRTTLRIGQR